MTFFYFGSCLSLIIHMQFCCKSLNDIKIIFRPNDSRFCWFVSICGSSNTCISINKNDTFSGSLPSKALRAKDCSAILTCLWHQNHFYSPSLHHRFPFSDDQTPVRGRPDSKICGAGRPESVLPTHRVLCNTILHCFRHRGWAG